MALVDSITDSAIRMCSAGKKAVLEGKTATWNEHQQVPLEDVHEVLRTLKQFSETKEKFFSKMLGWKTTRQRTINKLYEIANECNSLHRDCNIANVTGSSIGAAGGLMAVGGLFLAPFTFGASLSLAVAGAVTGITGAATNIITSIVESSKMKGNSLLFCTCILKMMLLDSLLIDSQGMHTMAYAVTRAKRNLRFAISKIQHSGVMKV